MSLLHSSSGDNYYIYFLYFAQTYIIFQILIFILTIAVIIFIMNRKIVLSLVCIILLSEVKIIGSQNEDNHCWKVVKSESSVISNERFHNLEGDDNGTSSNCSSGLNSFSISKPLSGNSSRITTYVYHSSVNRAGATSTKKRICQKHMRCSGYSYNPRQIPGQ